MENLGSGETKGAESISPLCLLQQQTHQKVVNYHHPKANNEDQQSKGTRQNSSPISATSVKSLPKELGEKPQCRHAKFVSALPEHNMNNMAGEKPSVSSTHTYPDHRKHPGPGCHAWCLHQAPRHQPRIPHCVTPTLHPSSNSQNLKRFIVLAFDQPLRSRPG